VVEVAARFPAFGRAVVIAALRLPQSRMRRVFGEWAIREVVVGTFNRRDFEVLKAFSAPDMEYYPAPEVAAVVGGSYGHDNPVVGPTDAVEFFRSWLAAWGGFAFAPQEGFDLGDGRVLVLNHIQVQGASSGIQLGRQEEAQLYESRRGLVSRVTQWWSWRQALEDLGLDGAGDPAATAPRSRP
jgi:hypothetical protein